MKAHSVLRREKDFASVYRRGTSVGSKYVVVFYRKNNLPQNRIAFLASKKVGNAVERNRAKRLMKESVRQAKRLPSGGYDIIFIARNTIKNQKCADVKKSIEAAIKRTDMH